MNPQLERCAKVLFDAEPHPYLEKVYSTSGDELTWKTAPKKLKEKYVNLARNQIKQLGYTL